MARNKSKIATFFKNCSLLLRCIISLASFVALWTGIVLYNASFGIYLLVIGAAATVFSLVINIIMPIIKLK